MAERIQRQRSKGYRLPPGAIYVGRPTVYGNPWRIGDPDTGTRPDGSPWDAEDLVRWYRGWMVEILRHHPDFLDPLRGHDLACWCRSDQRCHADTLLELCRG